jgi:hypothetical protein
MIDTARTGLKLLITGKLFKNNRAVMCLLLVGAATGATTLVVSSQFLPLWTASMIGGATTGLLQPLLFRDIKFAL